MKETYQLRFSIDRKTSSTAILQNKDEVTNLINSYDKHMLAQGYRRVSYNKIRIDKKHVTCISVDYTRV